MNISSPHGPISNQGLMSPLQSSIWRGSSGAPMAFNSLSNDTEICYFLLSSFGKIAFEIYWSKYNLPAEDNDFKVNIQTKIIENLLRVKMVTRFGGTVPSIW